MDKDEVIEVEMAITPAPESNSNIDAITSLFNPFPFTKDVIETIQARREAMSNELIFDLLLEQACIAAPQTLFPPATPDILQALVSSIALCPWDLLKKSALYFYLLSFMDQTVAQRNTALPPHFAALAQACFLLDQGDLPCLQRAVALLGDARIVQDLAPKVLQTLELANEPSLVRAYVRTAQPVLQAFEDAAIYVRALLDKSLADAWVFQRGFPEGSPVRNKLVKVILDACLMPSPHPKHLQHLLSLPLSTFESSLLQAYALSPPQQLSPLSYTLLQDLITARLLSSGKYSDAIRISKSFVASDNQFVRKYAGTSEAKVIARAAAIRKATMQDVLNVLPAIQRRELELELDESLASNSAMTDKAHMSSREADEREKLSNSMTMSWEDLGMTTSTTTIALTGRAGRLEGSPAPGMSASGIFNERNATRTPLNKMTASIFNDSPMSMASLSPMRTPTRSMIPPPLKKSSLTPLGNTAAATTTTTTNATAAAAALKSIPRPASITPQTLNFGRPSTSSFADSLSKITRFEKPAGAVSNLRNSGRFGIEPSPTPPPPPPSQPSASAIRPGGKRNISSSFSFDKSKNGQRPPVSGNLFGSTTMKTVPDEVTLVDSDDPDAFVIRRRKSYTFKSPPPPPLPTQSQQQRHFQHSSSSPPTEEPPSSPSARAKERNPSPSHSHSRPRHFPGSFSTDQSDELSEKPSNNGKPRSGSGGSRKPSSGSGKAAASTSIFNPPSRSSQSERPMTRSRIKIPGSLFDEESQDEEDDESHRMMMDGEEEEEERREEDDDIAALPPTPAPASKRRTRGRSSVSAGAGSVESGDDGDVVKLRRSSRLSSVEPVSPQKKRTSRKSQKDGTGSTSTSTRARKRKVADA